MKLNSSTKKLGELAKIVTGKLDANRAVKDGAYPFYTCADGVLRINEAAFDGESILVAGNGDFWVKYHPSGKFNAYQRTYVIQNLSKETTTRYLYFVVSTQTPKFKKMAQGGIIKFLHLGQLQDLKIPLLSLTTQKQIVERLDKIISAQKLNDELIQKTDELFQSLLHRELDPIGKNWEVKNLGEVAIFKRGPFGGSLKKEIFVPDGYKIYEQKNAIHNDFDIGSYFITKDKYNEMIDFAVKPGDLIISCSGTMGKVAIVPKNIRPGIINQALMRLTVLPKIITTEYLKFLMDSSMLQKKLFSNTKGSAIQNVASVKNFKNTKISLPPLKTQKQIVEKLSAVQEYKGRLREQKSKLKELFESVLQKSMQG